VKAKKLKSVSNYFGLRGFIKILFWKKRKIELLWQQKIKLTAAIFFE
tara:strand:- start:1411 stop:1551 length:141 start_codon:yes stop_codon:yes gene_type:complete